MFTRFSPYWLWGLLSIFPIFWTYLVLASSNPSIVHILVHPSGEWAARLLIFTLMITPLSMFFKNSALVRWMRRNRRYFGVASFAYAAMHTVFYVADKGSLAQVLDELPRLYILTGWLAFAIFVPLAATSVDFAVRKMGRHWKALQRWVYVSAVLTLVHWASLNDWNSPLGAVVHFTPLVVLEGYRIRHHFAMRMKRTA
ncbi:iron reductase [Metarhizobium album]|uniref:Iron reductase n=1 Tax=Metarhizobium album TaxID=2182425 RepID=A0A2U2DJJ1_9HYPH|nr:ferric reductase-like transmembrane domain-containing protein [Rhizobium album]PWE53440.1 iron reductase [Rhizobium album]